MNFKYGDKVEDKFQLVRRVCPWSPNWKQPPFPDRTTADDFTRRDIEEEISVNSYPESWTQDQMVMHDQRRYEIEGFGMALSKAGIFRANVQCEYCDCDVFHRPSKTNEYHSGISGECSPQRASLIAQSFQLIKKPDFQKYKASKRTSK